MGGINESVCPPPSKSAKVASLSPSGVDVFAVAKSSIRFHENAGEVHFHDDEAGFKCAIPSGVFYREYHAWRPAMSSGRDLSLLGTDGKGGQVSVRLIPYVDDHNQMQVATVVQRISVGKTVSDLDKLAQYS